MSSCRGLNDQKSLPLMFHTAGPSCAARAVGLRRAVPLPHHLATAYRRAAYTVAGLDLVVGRRSRALDGLLAGMSARDAVLITAWNPASRRMPPDWNARKMAALRHRLGSTPSLPASSAGAAWFEDQLLVVGDRRRLAVLARLFGQAAMVGLRRGQGVRLLPLV